MKEVLGGEGFQVFELQAEFCEVFGKSIGIVGREFFLTGNRKEFSGGLGHGGRIQADADGERKLSEIECIESLGIIGAQEF